MQDLLFLPQVTRCVWLTFYYQKKYSDLSLPVLTSRKRCPIAISLLIGPSINRGRGLVTRYLLRFVVMSSLAARPAWAVNLVLFSESFVFKLSRPQNVPGIRVQGPGCLICKTSSRHEKGSSGCSSDSSALQY